MLAAAAGQDSPTARRHTLGGILLLFTLLAQLHSIRDSPGPSDRQCPALTAVAAVDAVDAVDGVLHATGRGCRGVMVGSR